MGVLAMIRELVSPLSHSAREIRQENLSVAEANALAARQLLREERAYWEAYMARAATHGDREYAMDQLDRLRVLERAS